MKYMKFLLGAFILTLQGCGTGGPIIGYDESSSVNKESLSIIYLPPEIDMLEIDGTKKDSPFIESGYNEVHVTPGQHQIAVRYMKFWGDNTSGNIIKSKPVVLSLHISPKSKYYVKYKIPEDGWQAVELSNKFSPWVEDASGSKLTDVRKLVGGSMLTSSAEMNKPSHLPKGTSPLENLKYWWKQAGYNDKKLFEKWMSKN